MPYMMEEMDEETRRCQQECNQCAAVCTETITHCIEKGGRHAAPDHIGVLRDCAAICELANLFMLHRSPYAEQLCGLCAEVCEKCAESCDHLADDDHMRHCAEVCRRCAESCRRMAGVRA